MEDIFRIGVLFSDKASLASCIQRYQKENGVNLWKRHSRSIAAEAKRNPTKAAVIKNELCVSELNYCCVHGGRKHKPKLSTEDRPNQKTNKIGCPFALKFRSTKDGQRLMLVNMKAEHNHQIDQEGFHLYSSQRRLSNENREEVVEMYKLQANRKLICENLAEKTVKRIVMKDIHNIAVQAKVHASSCKETVDVLDNWITETYPLLNKEFVIQDNEITGLFLQDAQMRASKISRCGAYRRNT